MANWDNYDVTAGDTVHTVHGTGIVRRVSQNGYSHVDVDGQLYEVPTGDLKKSDEGEGGKEGKPVKPTMVKTGDRVQKKGEPTATGKVSDVTQRRVEVKYDNGDTQSYPKKLVGKYLEQEGSGGKGEQDKPENEKEEKPLTPEEQEQKSTAEKLHGILGLQKHMEDIVEERVENELKDIKEIAKTKQELVIKLDGKSTALEGLKHKQLEQLISYSALRLNPLLVGMAGTGKTHAGEQVSKALELDFYAMSVGAQTSKSDIIGYMSASGEYVTTHFRQAYEFGGVFLMDEIDAGNANVLIQVNAALSNNLCAFPDRMVERHKDFIFIASANTYGNGANRQYVGRNQLDAATLDRFAVIDWLIDDELESRLTTGLNGKAWYMAVRAARDYVAEKSIRALVSPRATQKGSKLLHIGQPLDEVIDATMLASVPQDKRADVKEVAVKIFNKFASDVPTTLPSEVNAPSVADLIK